MSIARLAIAVCLVTGCLLTGAVSVARATMLDVRNPSFEEPLVPMDGDPSTSSPGDDFMSAAMVIPAEWLISGANDRSVGQLTSHLGSFFEDKIGPTPDPTDADQAVWANRADTFLYQVLSNPLLPGNVYTLTADLGDRNDTPFPEGVELRLGFGQSVGVNLLTPISSSDSLPPDGGWASWERVFVVSDDSSGLGEPIRIELLSGGQQVLFDNIRLEALPVPEPPPLQGGDADMDLKFDQMDLAQVVMAAKYLTGQPATWGEGDWNGAPGGAPGNPPPGDGVFSQLDVVAALSTGNYLTGPYGAIARGGNQEDEQTSIVYDANTGELAVDAPASTNLTSINIDSATGIFTGNPAENLGGSFDNDSDDNLFKATFGGSFGSLSFGDVAQAGLSEEFLLNDLTVVGSLAGGGGIGDVDLIYVPEPSTIMLLVLALMAGFGGFRRRK